MTFGTVPHHAAQDHLVFPPQTKQPISSSTKLSKIPAILVFAILGGISYGATGEKDITNTVNSLMRVAGETPGISHIHLSK